MMKRTKGIGETLYIYSKKSVQRYQRRRKQEGAEIL